ncbi:hypothetical protein [Maridesulfovibrio sp.]|uniref:hypothetical protein n=1 Tax=Maridesulfovibrio sp. TaxID=2795000 RepID=UPI002A187462|nr:hypothetical protein [Maridesulfovibrio sp.]
MNVISFKGNYTGPYIYFISCKGHIYIGESKKIPLVNWAKHIFSEKEATLLSILKKKELDVTKEDIAIGCIPCSRLTEEVEKGLMGMVLRGLTHNIYKKCLQSALSLNRDYVVLSSGESAPAKSSLLKFNWLDEYSTDIFNHFWKAYTTHTPLTNACVINRI